MICRRMPFYRRRLQTKAKTEDVRRGKSVKRGPASPLFAFNNPPVGDEFLRFTGIRPPCRLCRQAEAANGRRNPQEKDRHSLSFSCGTPDGIRTHDLWLRRPTLYPAELLAQINVRWVKVCLTTEPHAAVRSPGSIIANERRKVKDLFQ